MNEINPINGAALNAGEVIAIGLVGAGVSIGAIAVAVHPTHRVAAAQLMRRMGVESALRAAGAAFLETATAMIHGRAVGLVGR